LAAENLILNLFIPRIHLGGSVNLDG